MSAAPRPSTTETTGIAMYYTSGAQGSTSFGTDGASRLNSMSVPVARQVSNTRVAGYNGYQQSFQTNSGFTVPRLGYHHPQQAQSSYNQYPTRQPASWAHALPEHTGWDHHPPNAWPRTNPAAMVTESSSYPEAGQSFGEFSWPEVRRHERAPRYNPGFQFQNPDYAYQERVGGGGQNAIGQNANAPIATGVMATAGDVTPISGFQDPWDGGQHSTDGSIRHNMSPYPVSNYNSDQGDDLNDVSHESNRPFTGHGANSRPEVTSPRGPWLTVPTNMGNEAFSPSPTPSTTPSNGSGGSQDPVCCPVCGKGYTGEYRKGNLARHRRQKHGREIQTYPCEEMFCSQVFQRQDARLKHYRKHHPRRAPQPALSRKYGSSS